MKGIAPIVIFVILAAAIVGILYVTGVGLNGKASLVTIGGDTCSLVRPIFGRYECGPMTQKVNEYQDWFTGNVKTGQKYFQCNANTPSCDVSVSCDWSSAWGGVTGNIYLSFQQDGNTLCTPGSSKWCTSAVGYNSITKVATLQQGQRIRMGICTNSFDIFQGGTYTQVYETYTPYGMFKYYSGSAKTPVNSQLCTIADTSNVIKSCGDMAGKASADSRSMACTQTASVTGLGKTLNVDGLLTFGDWVNELDFYVDVPMISNVKNYNSQNVMCEPNGNKVDLYTIGKFTTEGACYFIENTKVATVDCCNDEKYQNQVCQNWHWVTVTQNTKLQCYSNLDCSNTGLVYVVNGERFQQQCVNNACKTTDLGAAQCSTNSQCQSGFVCDSGAGGSYTCVRSIPNVLCGDGICTSPYENEATCPVDCKNGFFSSIYDFLSWFVIGLIISAVLLGVLVMFTPLKFLLASGWKMVIAGIILLGLGIGLLLMWVIG